MLTDNICNFLAAVVKINLKSYNLRIPLQLNDCPLLSLFFILGFAVIMTVVIAAQEKCAGQKSELTKLMLT